VAARDDVRWRGGGEQHMQTPRSAQRCPQRQVVCQTMIWDPPPWHSHWWSSCTGPRRSRLEGRKAIRARAPREA
jgi:hypothetical protein